MKIREWEKGKKCAKYPNEKFSSFGREWTGLFSNNIEQMKETASNKSMVDFIWIVEINLTLSDSSINIIYTFQLAYMGLLRR